MTKYLINSVLFALVLQACGKSADSELKYYGPDTFRADLNYTSYFDISVDDLSINDLDGEIVFDEMIQDDQEVISRRMLYHTKFLIGTFTYQEKPTDFYSFSAGIDETPHLPVQKIKYIAKYNVLRVTYEYIDRGVFYKDLFDGQDSAEISFYLPRDPETFYEFLEKLSFKKDPKTGELLVPCTSEEDNAEDALYYYWSPDLKDCPRSKIMRQLVKVDATIEKISPSAKTFPRYERLYQNRTKDNPLRATVVYGVDRSFKDPQDLSRLAWSIDGDRLLKWPSLVKHDLVDGQEHAEHSYEFEFSWGFAQIRFLLLEPGTEVFNENIKTLLQTEDVFIYSGHSAEGAYFRFDDLYPDVEKFRLPDKYQVFFMNACTTYSYYHNAMFAEKSNNILGLDLVVNAIGASFLTENRPNYTQRSGTEVLMLSSLLGLERDGQPLEVLGSWQDILDKMYKRSGFEDSALTVLLGDEDNPTVLEEALNEHSPL